MIRNNDGVNISPESKETASSELRFFIYPFAEKEVATIPVVPTNKDQSFGFNLANDELFGRTYVKEIHDTVTSSAAKSFQTCK